MPVEPQEDDSFLLISDDFELLIEKEEDGWCHVAPNFSETLETSREEPSASGSSPPLIAHVSPSPRKHEDLFFLDGHYEDAIPNDNEGEETGAADIRVVEDIEVKDVEVKDIEVKDIEVKEVEEEQGSVSDVEEDYEEFWEADELVDAYCLNYGHDDVLDKSAEDFGAKRKISLKGSRQRKKEAARRSVGKDVYMNQNQVNWREYKKHVNKKTFQNKRVDWATYKRKINKKALRPGMWDEYLQKCEFLFH